MAWNWHMVEQGWLDYISEMVTGVGVGGGSGEVVEVQQVINKR